MRRSYSCLSVVVTKNAFIHRLSFSYRHKDLSLFLGAGLLRVKRINYLLCMKIRYNVQTHFETLRRSFEMLQKFCFNFCTEVNELNQKFQKSVCILWENHLTGSFFLVINILPAFVYVIVCQSNFVPILFMEKAAERVYVCGYMA